MPGFSAVSTHHIKLALDSSNMPYMAFQDAINMYGSGTVMKYNGSVWENVGPAPFSESPAGYISLALDSHNTPYVAYQDFLEPSYYGATVIKYNGSAWVPVGSRGISAGTAVDTSLALDSHDIPYVAFQDFGTSGYGVRVMKYNGSAWENVGPVNISGDYAFQTSLALDKNNTPYVAFINGQTAHMATVMKYTGGVWVFVGSANFSAGSVDDISLALDSTNTPYVAYTDYANGEKATVMKYTGSAWVVLGQAGFSAGKVYATSLALDSSNTPYVAYVDLANGGSATVMKFSSGAWVTVGSPGFSVGGMGPSTSLVLDSNNTPYLAYPGGGALANKATVMKYYAVLPPADFNKTAPTNAATEVNPNAILSWAASDGADSYEYCVDTINNNVCDSNWISAGVKTSVSPTGLKTKTTYYWQVRAMNTGGTTYADTSVWGSFTTGNYKVYLPALKR
jgi:hypothetical protein